MRVFSWRRWAQDPAVEGRVWDGAGGHQGPDRQVGGSAPGRAAPYALEWNPVARFLAEVQRAGAGRPYRSLREKQHAVTAVLRLWQAGPARVRPLCGGTWIQKSLNALSAREAVT